MTYNIIGFIACLSVAMIMLIIAIVFVLFKEKATILISGFNSLSKQEREYYDKNKLSTDTRNLYTFLGSILLIGAILSYYFSYYFAIISFILWLIIFFKNVKFDSKKAFEKYKL